MHSCEERQDAVPLSERGAPHWPASTWRQAMSFASRWKGIGRPARWGDTQLEASQADSRLARPPSFTSVDLEMTPIHQRDLGTASLAARPSFLRARLDAAQSEPRQITDHAGRCSRDAGSRRERRPHGRTSRACGPLRLERAYYDCELCEAGFCPRDATTVVRYWNPNLRRATSYCTSWLGWMFQRKRRSSKHASARPRRA